MVRFNPVQHPLFGKGMDAGPIPEDYDKRNGGDIAPNRNALPGILPRPKYRGIDAGPIPEDLESDTVEIRNKARATEKPLPPGDGGEIEE